MERIEQTRRAEAVSQTAIFAAQVRAAHAVLDHSPILEDPYAMVLADASEEEIRALFDLIPPACARVARVLPNQRARFVDEQVEHAVRGRSPSTSSSEQVSIRSPGDAPT